MVVVVVAVVVVLVVLLPLLKGCDGTASASTCVSTGMAEGKRVGS